MATELECLVRTTYGNEVTPEYDIDPLVACQYVGERRL